MSCFDDDVVSDSKIQELPLLAGRVGPPSCCNVKQTIPSSSSSSTMPWCVDDDVVLEFDREFLKLQLLIGRALILSRVEAKAKSADALGLAARAWIVAFRRAAAEAQGILDGFERRRREAEEYSQALVRLAADVRSARARVTTVVRVVYKSGMLDAAAQAPENLFRQTTSLMYDPPGWVVGRDGDVEAAVALLLGRRYQRRAQVLAVMGPAGVGKTALAKMVFNDARVKKHFDLTMWDWVGDCVEDGCAGQFGTNAVLRSVIEAARCGGDDDVQACDDLDLLAQRLGKAIGGRRFLLVLDDVWNEDERRWVDKLRPVLCASGLGAPGSVVVVTSRSTRVGEIMGTLPPIVVAPLGEDDSWELFSKHAFGSGVRVKERRELDQLELVDVGRDIVHRCQGLPLALRTFGALVSTTKHAWEWRDIRDSPSDIRDSPSSFVTSRPQAKTGRCLKRMLAFKRNA